MEYIPVRPQPRAKSPKPRRRDFDAMARRPSVSRSSPTASAGQHSQSAKAQACYIRSGTPMPRSDNPVFSTSAVTAARASLDERISPSDLRIGHAS